MHLANKNISKFIARSLYTQTNLLLLCSTFHPECLKRLQQCTCCCKSVSNLVPRYGHQCAPFFGIASFAKLRRSLIPTFVAAVDVHRRSSVRPPDLVIVACSRISCSRRSRRFSTLLTLLSRAFISFSRSLVHISLSTLMFTRDRERVLDESAMNPKRSTPKHESIYHSSKSAVEVQGLKQVPGTRFPFLVVLVASMTLHSQSHAFSLTGKSYRVIASTDDTENIA